NVVSRNGLYQGDSRALLEGNEKAATQPCEVGRRISEQRGSASALLARLEESEPVEGAHSVWDKREGFRTRLEKTGPIENIKSNDAQWTDCVDRIALLVGHQKLTGKGPETRRRYSWSFNLYARVGGERRDMWSSWKVVNLPDAAVLARYDHVVAERTHMVKRNSGVVRVAA